MPVGAPYTLKPPLDIFANFVKEHGHPTAHNRTVRTAAAFQNGIAERPNRTFGKMVRSLLHGAGLGPEYWSFALLHAVYIKNRLRHHSTN